MMHGVACITISNGEPYIPLADDTEKKDQMSIYLFNDLDKIFSEHKSRGGWEKKILEIPKGPRCAFCHPSCNHLAIYKNKRPDVMDEFKG